MVAQYQRSSINSSGHGENLPSFLEEGKRTFDDCPFYHLVPKDDMGNVEFRLEMIELGCMSEASGKLLWEMCRQDLLFFINTFVLIYEPRSGDILPFNTYGMQDDTIVRVRDAFGETDIGIEKSRDQGATWIILAIILWRWIFWTDQSFMLTSRNADLVDKAGSRDALFAKLDFMIRNLPGFIRPKIDVDYTRTYLCIENKRRNNAINGATSTGDAGRGGRNTAAFMDELSAFSLSDGYEVMKATQYNTRCRIFVATPKGKVGAYYEIMHKPDARLLKIRMHWSKHPLQARGMYTSQDGKLEIKDTNYRFPPDYPFILDGKLRSPYYDEECGRAIADTDIAAELDIDYGGSDAVFFDSATLDRYASDFCKPPLHRIPLKTFLKDQQVDLTPSAWERITSAMAMVSTWVQSVEGVYPDDRMYGVGADVSAGTGASNSVLAVVEGRTGTKVLEFSCPRILPHELAAVAVAIAKMFTGSDGNPAKIIWEANGPGRQFGQVVIDLEHYNIFFHVTNDTSINKKRTEIPGWSPTPDTQRALLDEYKRALMLGDYIEKSEDAINEARQYVHQPDGTVKHRLSVANMDPSGAKKNHGDRVTASALAWHIIKVPGMFRRGKEEKAVAEAQPGTFAHRRQRYEDEEAKRPTSLYVFGQKRTYSFARSRHFTFSRGRSVTDGG
jgi:hypothetical protein